MALIVAGIDEAGYGPLLGPLCVGAAVFRIAEWTGEEGAPDLWKLLNRGVCRKPNDKRRRIAVEDSKKLKLANDCEAHHPLTYLERGVLSFLAAAGSRPESDLTLLELLGASCDSLPWYDGDGRRVPVAHTPEELLVAANAIVTAMHGAGIELAALRCRAIGERTFNQTVADAGTKAAATEIALGSFLRGVWEKWAAEEGGPPGGPRVICDRQGGRTDYADVLARLVPGSSVEVLEESPRCCRYRLTATAAAETPKRQMTVHFLTEAEGKHLPVALASMAAKYVRELMMARFNAYWCARCPELKPTAGYRSDAWRWLEDATRAGVVDGDARREMVRRA